MVDYLRKDMADPDMRPMAIRRAIGLGVTAALPYAATAMMKAALGIDDEEMEAARQAVPEWNKLSNLIPVGRREDGRLELMDAGYVDLYALWRTLPNALLNGDPIDEDMANVGKEFLEPFFGMDITAQAITETLLNKRLQGGRVFDPASAPETQMEDIFGHLTAPFTPSTMLQMEKMRKSLGDYTTRSGEKLDFGTETAALFGYKKITADAARAMHFGNYEFQMRKAGATWHVSRAIGDPNPLSDEDLRASYERAKSARGAAYEGFIRKVQAAKLLGESEYGIRRELRSLGVAKRDVPYLMRGEVPPWRSSSQSFSKPEKKAGVLYDAEAEAEIRRRRRLVTSWVRMDRGVPAES